MVVGLVCMVPYCCILWYCGVVLCHTVVAAISRPSDKCCFLYSTIEQQVLRLLKHFYCKTGWLKYIIVWWMSCLFPQLWVDSERLIRLSLVALGKGSRGGWAHLIFLASSSTLWGSTSGNRSFILHLESRFSRKLTNKNPPVLKRTLMCSLEHTHVRELTNKTHMC